MKNPYKPLDPYEEELMEFTESTDFSPIKGEDELKAQLQQMAKNTSKKDQRMNIRVTRRDMDGIKAIANQEGIGYQTLVASIIHKYVNENLNKHLA